MKADPHELGRVVVSTCGHDRGRRFLVVGLLDERIVLLADGDTRKLNHLKKKQVKHLRAEPVVAMEALAAAQAGAQTADSDIRKALKATATLQMCSQPGTTGNIDEEECAFVQK